MPIEDINDTDAVQVAVGKAVTNHLLAADLSQLATIERSYADWELKLETMDLLELQQDIDKLRIDVVVHTTLQELSMVSRGAVRYVVPVDIAVRRKFGADKADDATGRVRIEEVDKLVKLVQEINLLFSQQRLAEFQYAVWDGEKGGTSILACPQQSHLREKRQFTGLVRVFFRADVSL